MPDEAIYYFYWADSTGGTTIYPLVDEGYDTYDDGDYVYSAYGNAPLRLGLENTDLPNGDYQFQVKARIASNDSEAPITLSVYSGASLLLTQQFTGYTGYGYPGGDTPAFSTAETAVSSPTSMTAAQMNDLRVWLVPGGGSLACCSVISLFVT